MSLDKEVPNEKMRKLFPGLMDALEGHPKDVIYCDECDGLRLKNHEHGGQFYQPGWLK